MKIIHPDFVWKIEYSVTLAGFQKPIFYSTTIKSMPSLDLAYLKKLILWSH